LLIWRISDKKCVDKAKLLRTLETGEIEKIGSASNIKVNVRVIAATNQNLEKKIAEKKEPWSVNNIAEMAGITVLDDTEYIERTLNWITEEKKYMYEKLDEISGIKVYETEVNFITGKIDEKLFSEGLNVKVLREKMLEQGILIRDASNFKFLDERFFRLAIKDRASNDRVIEAMKEIADVLGL